MPLTSLGREFQSFVPINSNDFLYIPVCVRTMKVDVIPSSMFCPVLPHFIGSMVTSICWNDRTNMVAAMQENKFVVCYHPAVVYADKDLLPLTIVHKEGRWVGVHVCGVCGWGCMCVVCSG